jgi:hypothetical protein
MILARYTCVALQRLNGSAKKVKGSLLDKSVRIDMDSPVFRKLQEAIEHPCRSREWFALTEQAINTVYALGDQPEVLSNTIIKNLTRRAFRRREKSASSVPEDQPSSTPNPDGMDEDPPPQSTTQALISTMPGSTQGSSVANPAKKSDDTGDAFELSQLLFVVGHVAIKHIVYLELVEREWKRQKQEKELGEPPAASLAMSMGYGNTYFCFYFQLRSSHGALEMTPRVRMGKNSTRLLATQRTRSATALPQCGRPNCYMDPTRSSRCTGPCSSAYVVGQTSSRYVF